MEGAMKKRLIFNPQGNDSIIHRKLIGGNISNLINMNQVAFPWATALYKKMLENFWIPEQVPMSQDISCFNTLSSEEKRAFKGILSFLIFLDSIQTSNIPRLSDYFTAAELIQALSIHAFQESVHSQSYQYLIESLFSDMSEKEAIYDFWKDDKVLFKRNQEIAQIYQDFSDDPSELNFTRSIIANYLLEGLYFYNGFNFFYSLESRGLMKNTATMIRYIQRDELVHCTLFENILRELNLDPDLVYGITKAAVEAEIEWSIHILDDSILGINHHSIIQYTYHMADYRLKKIGLEPLYGAPENPYKHLEKNQDIGSSGTVFANFFEEKVVSYSHSSAVDGWDW
jgi:ribonucleoside-diphosphate reductase beta chain